MPIISDVYAETVLKIEAYIGSSIASKELKIIHMDFPIIKFLEFSPLGMKAIASVKQPSGTAKAVLKERPNRVGFK